tara:strand:+ start:767 stop:1135 length:369 start_codon:yes stop_codon:yes gene_type:complete
MAKIRFDQIDDYIRGQVKELVKEGGIDVRNRLVSLSPVGEVNGGTFKSNWQPPINEGLVSRVINNTQNYGEAITFGGAAKPRSWGGRFRSRFSLPEKWPEVLALKETKEALPGIWSNIVRRG